MPGEAPRRAREERKKEVERKFCLSSTRWKGNEI